MRHTGIYINGELEAVSGSWFTWYSYTDEWRHLSNFETGADLNLGKQFNEERAFSLGQGRFLFSNGAAINYLVDPF